MKVREIMTRKVTTAGPSMALREAADVLVRRRLRAVPVIDEEGHVLGMLTDGQLMTHFLPALEEPGGGRAVPGAVTGNVRDIMERTVMCVNEDEPLANVVRLMLDREIERLPVVREGQLVGFLTRGDIIRRLLRRDMDETTQDNKTED
ncbi:HPP family protein [Candidatus Palauibacter sp.]|uniref:CBS domain-containing protein n=1 Tax=Candidatus Palauibacter sp. TaxID=3101350 RepID=UPI003B5C7E58